MDILELRNFLQSEGEELNEVAVPTIDISEDQLVDICDAIESDGLDILIKNVGTISNTFRTENDYSCSTEVITEAVKLIHVSLERLYLEISAAQGDDSKGTLANIDRATKHKFRKYMAVLFFLVNQSFVEIERAVTAEDHNISVQMATAGNPRKKGSKRQTDLFEASKYSFWSRWRPKILQQLWKLIAPPMHEIWEGNNEGSFNFMRCLTLALCTTIKNKVKRLRSLDDELEDIFDILGILSAMHQEQKGIMARLIPLLKGSEDTANIIASGIDRMIKLSPDQAQNIVLHALSETIDMYMSRFDKESGQERGFHGFLTQLCMLQPKGAMHSLPVIVQFLESESQIVRNAVLVVASELMNWTWKEMTAEENPENLEDQGERVNSGGNWVPLRTKLLDEILLHHMRDSNSFVRTKAINLLSGLITSEMVLPQEAIQILKNVKLRLLDKTVTARKAATSLVIDLVKKYPHMVRPVEEFADKRDRKIQEILSTIQRDESNAATSLYFVIKEFTLHTQMESFLISPSIKREIKSQEDALKMIENFLKEEQYWKACEVMYFAIQKWNTELQQILLSLKKSDNDTEEELYLRFFKACHSDVFPEDPDSLEFNELNYLAPKKVEDCRQFLDYIQSCWKMAIELDKCQPSLRKLLELGTTTDKKEAVMFYSAICEAGFKASHSITVSIINALSQLNAAELKDFVDPFKCIFIGTDSYGPVGTIRKILQLVGQLSESLVESLAGMIGELYRSHVLTSESVKILWDAFSLSTGNWEPSDSRSAAYILGIIGQIEKKVVTSNLTQLINVGLGERALADYELAKVTLQTILYGCRLDEDPVELDIGGSGRGKKAVKAINRSKASEGIKFPPSHDLFVKILALVEHGLKEEGAEEMDFMYSKVVELSMQIVYRMCTEPNEVVMKIIPNIHGLVFGSSSSALSSQSQNLNVASQPPISSQIPNIGSQSQAQNQNADDPFKSSEKILFRYMSLGKALLGAHITFYEQIVTKEVKNRKGLLDKSKKKKKTQNRERNSRVSTISNMSNGSSPMNQSNNDAAAEMDVIIGNIGFDAEADNIKTYISKLLDTGFFRNFRIHVMYLCQTFENIKSINLKLSVVQALTKLMLICETSVRKHLQYLLKLWSKDETFAVKLEILKASIRLTIKFPNQMEEMNDGFSSGLAHRDARVRKASMDYIQYLALSDLLKVREQLSDCAACLCDESFELREMARDFINQIAEKDNVLQNCIPDIISRLSTREDITQENFQIIMKTLLTKIKKEKQLGGLVERIVGRFKGPVSVRVCQDTAFCLTQIQQNEKTLKILKDNLNVYADKLGDEFVWEYFKEVLDAIKKALNKPELKTKIDEWEKDLEENHAKCVALNNAQNAAKRKNEKPNRIMESESSSDEENDEGEGQEDQAQANENGNENEAEEMEEGANEQDSTSPKDDDNSEEEQMEQSIVKSEEDDSEMQESDEQSNE